MFVLCDKYAPDSPLYPKDPKQRAIVNHRLCFSTTFYYSNICAYVVAPIFFDYARTPLGLKKMNMSLEAFEAYLKQLDSKYAAGDNLTIADFPLITATFCLEAIDFDLNAYPLIKKWYENFKIAHPELWAIGDEGMKVIAYLDKNLPDLSGMNHPFHPIRKIKK